MKSSEYILKTSKEYSLYVCSNRAIPNVTDGLKDGQRKALWLLRNQTDKIKTVSVAGNMISSNLYLHGDASAAGTVSLLAAPFVNNVPLVEGIGSFGSRISPISGIGSPRYTYVKKSKFADKVLFRDIDIIPMKENYDGSVLEPQTFLPIIPLVLLNGISGIAVGWSTEILPRSLEDIKKATVAAIEGKKIPEMKPTYSFLDSKTERFSEDSPNAWEFSGRIEAVDHATVKITELPPGLDFEKFKDRLDKMEEEGKIVSYDDNSTNVIDITVKFKKGHFNKYPFVEKEMLDFLKLKTRNSERIVVLDFSGKKIKQYASAEDVVKDFVEWRLGYYIKRYEKQKKDLIYNLNFVNSVILCFEENLPNDVLSLQNRREIEDRVTSITKSLNIDSSQIDKIVSLPIYRWSKESLAKFRDEKKALEKDLAYVNDLLSNPKKIREIFKKEVLEI